jgi:hypothetical protein
LKQRIVRILVEEIIADVDDKHREIVLLIHWSGGRHSQLKVKKKATGQHNRTHSPEAVEIVRRMANSYSDEQIAATMNRMGLRTGAGNTWNYQRVYGLRRSHHLPAPTSRSSQTLTLEQTAEQLGVSATCVRHMIERKLIAATQIVDCAPWETPASVLESPDVTYNVSGSGGTGKSHLAQATRQEVILQGYKVLYREVHVLLDELADAVADGTRKEYMQLVATVPLLILDDFGMRKLPHTAAEDLLEIVMRRY